MNDVSRWPAIRLESRKIPSAVVYLIRIPEFVRMIRTKIQKTRMKSTPKPKTVQELLDLKKNKLLEVDPEYQRGPVWTRLQKQYFIDSILRGYHIPLIYLHHKQAIRVGGLQTGDRLYIIDGQQRVLALYEFSEGAFPLLDPREHPGRFPKSLIDSPCQWAGRDMHQLDDDTRAHFLNMSLSVVHIETKDENEIRDLFIRLQGGKPLTPQEQRDAWPGAFGAFVCQVAGKRDVAKYPGQDFFRKLLRANVAAKTPKGRQLAAQMIMLFFTYREDRRFCDINRQAVDSYYVKHMDFDNSSPLAKEFLAALSKATERWFGLSEQDFGLLRYRIATLFRSNQPTGGIPCPNAPVEPTALRSRRR